MRAWRTHRGLSLDDVCELIAKEGFEKPSAAKLSRIEREQNIPIDMIPLIETVMGIPAKEQRPDVAKIFGIEADEVAQ